MKPMYSRSWHEHAMQLRAAGLSYKEIAFAVCAHRQTVRRYLQRMNTSDAPHAASRRRDAEAARLRAEGLLWREIAARLGYADAQRAMFLVRRRRRLEAA